MVDAVGSRSRRRGLIVGTRLSLVIAVTTATSPTTATPAAFTAAAGSAALLITGLAAFSLAIFAGLTLGAAVVVVALFRAPVLVIAQLGRGAGLGLTAGVLVTVAALVFAWLTPRWTVASPLSATITTTVATTITSTVTTRSTCATLWTSVAAAAVCR
jgi:hypothetical protein